MRRKLALPAHLSFKPRSPTGRDSASAGCNCTGKLIGPFLAIRLVVDAVEEHGPARLSVASAG